MVADAVLAPGTTEQRAREIIARVSARYSSTGPLREVVTGTAANKRGLQWRVSTELVFERPDKWTLGLADSSTYRFKFERNGDVVKRWRDGVERETKSVARLIGSVQGCSAASGGIAGWTFPIIVGATDLWSSHLSRFTNLEIVRSEDSSSDIIRIRASGPDSVATLSIDAKTFLLRRVEAVLYGERSELDFRYPSGAARSP